MSTKVVENYEQIYNRLDTFDQPPASPSPEPIFYDLTSSDKTDLVKAAGPIERGEIP